ncbi:hypothetical protein DSM107133_02974 [Pseudosulfitobacter sp. DSM 107133]|nr:hypothetical protein DSM107133_02974 [Pseudosulfitobacter sp. DSM 107133]
MARFDLTDFEWSVIQPLLPTKVRGKPRVDAVGRISGAGVSTVSGSSCIECSTKLLAKGRVAALIPQLPS